MADVELPAGIVKDEMLWLLGFGLNGVGWNVMLDWTCWSRLFQVGLHVVFFGFIELGHAKLGYRQVRGIMKSYVPQQTILE